VSLGMAHDPHSEGSGFDHWSDVYLDLFCLLIEKHRVPGDACIIQSP
jgi:hypothetical protein